MRIIVSIFFLLVTGLSFGQQWRDSLEAARSAYENKEYGEALKYYESAQKNAPENIDLSDEMAQSAYKAREYKKAEEIYKQNSNRKKTEIEKADNFYNTGNAKMKNKDYQGAIESYKESLRLNPNDEQTRYNLSEALRQLKNQQEQQDKKDQKDDNQDNQDNQDQKDNKDQNKNEGDDGQNDDKNNQNQGDQNKNENGDGNSQQNKSNLPNKTVDKLLDKLMKQEAETKRKVNGSKGGNGSPKSGKDW